MKNSQESAASCQVARLYSLMLSQSALKLSKPYHNKSFIRPISLNSISHLLVAKIIIIIIKEKNVYEKL